MCRCIRVCFILHFMFAITSVWMVPCNSNSSKCTATLSHNNYTIVCVVKDLLVNPNQYPSSTQLTAPAPTWEDASLYEYKRVDGTHTIAFNLTWSQTGSDFRRLVHGYILSIVRTQSFAPIYRLFTFPVYGLLADTTIDDSKVIVNYACFGTAPDEKVEPGLTYSFQLKALPTYHDNNKIEPQREQQVMSVPYDNYDDSGEYDDDNEEKSNLTPMENYFDSDDNYDDSDEYEEKPSLTQNDDVPAVQGLTTNIVVVIIISIIVVLVLGCVIRKIVRTQKAHIIAKQSVLMLISTSRSAGTSPHVEVASMVGTVLQDYGNVELSFNLWETSVNDPYTWLEEKLNRCNSVVFVCTPLGKRNYEQKVTEPFVLGVKTFLFGHKRKPFGFSSDCSYSILYFGDPLASIPAELKLCGLKSFAMNKFKDFFHSVTGKKAKVVPVRIIRQLSTAKYVTDILNDEASISLYADAFISNSAFSYNNSNETSTTTDIINANNSNSHNELKLNTYIHNGRKCDLKGGGSIDNKSLARNQNNSFPSNESQAQTLSTQVLVVKYGITIISK